MRKLRIVVIVVAALQVGLPLAVPARPAAKAKTTVSLVATPLAIDEGRTAQLSGKVKSTKKACIKGRTVELASSAAGNGDTTTTNKKGKYSFSVVVNEDSTFGVEVAGTSVCKPTSSAERTILVFHLPPPTFEGPSTGPAADAIPDAMFPNPHPEDFTFSDTIGVLMSTREFLVGFAAGVTVAQANALLDEVDGAIVGGNPEVGWVLVRRDVDATPDDFLTLMDQLDGDPRVAFVSPEATLEPTALPDTDPHPVDPPGARTTPEWTWETTPGGGNWGLEASRAPQAWNLQDEAVRGAAAPAVGIIDGGFDATNPDLVATGNGPGASPARLVVDTFGGRNPIPADAALRDHGTAVAGLIAARFGNTRLLDGIAGERATTVGVATRGAGALTPDEQIIFRGRGTNSIFMLRVLDEFVRLRDKYPAIKVFNASLGFPHDYCHPENHIQWRAAGLSGTPAQQAAARQFIDWTGKVFVQASPSLAAEKSVLFVAATANDSDHDGTVMPAGPGCLNPTPPQLVQAQWGSPWCNAALGQPPGKRADWILCVEATRRPVAGETGYHLAPFSNISGHMAAPGAALAVLNSTNSRVSYPAGGTSFASPLVAGAAPWLYSIGNRSAHGPTPAQTLTLQNVKDLLIQRSGLTEDGTVRTLDMFYAAMGIDILKGNKLLQKALVDVDDGSLDGNSRLDDDDSDRDGDLDELFPGGIVTDDKRLGNGFVSMSDFRAFRDAMLAAMREKGLLLPQDVRLRADPTHFKFDQNLDGCVHTDVPSPRHPEPYTNSPNCSLAPKESVFSRFDFNGDGVLNGASMQPGADEVAPFKIDPQECTGLSIEAVGGCLRDIDVLADKDIWQFGQDGVFVTAQPPLEPPCDDNTHWTPPSRLISDVGGPTGVDTPDGTIDYILSADVHISIPEDPTHDMNHVFVEVTTELPDGDSVDNDADGKTDEAFERGITRCYDARLTPDRTILTVPLFTNLVKVTVLGRDDDVDPDGNLAADPYNFCRTFSLRYGQDLKIEATPGADNNTC